MEVSIISKFNNQSNQDELVNEKIRFKEVLVIAQNGDQLGVMSRFNALNAAYDANLDLVCVAKFQYVVLWTMENIVLNNKRN